MRAIRSLTNLCLNLCLLELHSNLKYMYVIVGSHENRQLNCSAGRHCWSLKHFRYHCETLIALTHNRDYLPKSQTSTCHSCTEICKLVITHCSPFSVMVYLQSPFLRIVTKGIDQSHWQVLSVSCKYNNETIEDRLERFVCKERRK